MPGTSATSSSQTWMRSSTRAIDRRRFVSDSSSATVSWPLAAARWVALLGRGHAPADDGAQVGVTAAQRREGGGALPDDAPDQAEPAAVLAAVAEGQFAGQHLEQDDAQRVDVGRGVGERPAG